MRLGEEIGRFVAQAVGGSSLGALGMNRWKNCPKSELSVRERSTLSLWKGLRATLKLLLPLRGPKQSPILDRTRERRDTRRMCRKNQAIRSARFNLSINPAQIFLYLLSNRVAGPIRYSSRVRRHCTRTCGDLGGWLLRACYGHRINANWARSAWIKIACDGGIENISPIANSDLRRLFGRQECVTARLKHLPKWQIRVTRMTREVLCCHSKWKSL